MSDTEARKHIRTLIRLVVVGNPNAARWCDYCGSVDPEHQPDCPVFAAEEYLATPEPAVLAVEGGGDEPEAIDFANWSYNTIPERTGNADWQPDLQDLIYTAINHVEGDYGDADENAAEQVIERLVLAIKALLARHTSQLAKQSEEMAGMRRAVLEEAAKIIEDGIEVCSASGSYMGKRRGGDVNGLFYAKAIRALIDPKTGEG